MDYKWINFFISGILFQGRFFRIDNVVLIVKCDFGFIILLEKNISKQKIQKYTLIYHIVFQYIIN